MASPIPNGFQWGSRIGAVSAVAGGIGLFADRATSSHLKLQKIKMQNNQLKFDREKFKHQQRQDKIQTRLKNINQIKEIYEAENRNEISPKQSKSLIKAIQMQTTAPPIKDTKPIENTNTTSEKSRFGSISIANNKKKIFTEKNLRNNAGFEEIDDLSFDLLISPIISGAFVGLVCYLVMYRLWVWRNVILHKIKNLFL